MIRILGTVSAMLATAAAMAADCRVGVLSQRAAHCRQVQQVVAVQHHAVQQVVALQPVQVAVPVGAYYQVGQQVREQANEDRIALRVMQLLQPHLEQLRQPLAAPQAMTQPQWTPPPQPVTGCPTGTCPAPQPAAQPQPQQPPPPQPAATGSDIESRTWTYLKNSCVRCHNPNKASGGVDLSTLELARQQSCRVFKVVYSGTMPKGGPKPTDPEAALVLEWFLAIDD